MHIIFINNSAKLVMGVHSMHMWVLLLMLLVMWFLLNHRANGDGGTIRSGILSIDGATVIFANNTAFI